MVPEALGERILLNLASNRSSRLKSNRIPIFPSDKPLEINRKGEFSTDSFRGSPAVWQLLKPQLLDIHRKVFDGIVQGGRVKHYLFELVLGNTISSPTTEVILLRNKQGKIVGFTNIFPSPVPSNHLSLNLMGTRSKEFADFHKKGMSFASYQDMQRRTLEIGETAILPEYRNRGGWSLMMQTVDERAQALKNNGAYDWMLRVVRQNEGYSEHVRQRYPADSLVYRRSLDQALGPQEYFRFKL